MTGHDDDLAVRAQAGDAQAFDALVRREKAGLYTFVRRYVGNSADAYDVLQDTFFFRMARAWALRSGSAVRILAAPHCLEQMP